MEQIKLIFTNISIFNIIDIVIVYFLLYKGYMLIKNMRAKQLVKGIVLILVITQLSGLFELFTLSWILNSTLQAGFIALVILFQPELRRALEYIGRTSMFSLSSLDKDVASSQKVIKEISTATSSLSRQKIGALMIFEIKTGLNEIIDTGVTINSEISSGLLINIFIPNTPLHDGAVIIRDYRIAAAGCFLPLTDNNQLSKDIGTRHRAALGMTEKSDAIAVIVSEETGYISYAIDGKLYRNIQIEELERVLAKIYLDDDKPKIFEKWRSIYENKKR
ncbi:MAG TPA: TIGR00159 family protein [Clostridiales bacterium]|nr:TIGR00159 family protein [Clostridiales bacterium]